MASIPLMIQGISMILKHIADTYTVPAAYQSSKLIWTYFGELAEQLKGGNQNISSDSPLFYLSCILYYNGPIYITLLFAALLSLVYRIIKEPRKSLADILIAGSICIPFICYGLIQFKAGRTIAIIEPAAAIALAVMLRRLIRINTGILLCIGIAVFLPRLATLNHVLHYRSGYPQAMRFMAEHEGIKHLSTQYTISKFYGGRNNTRDVTHSLENTEGKEDLSILPVFYERDGFRYLLIDQARYIGITTPAIAEIADTVPCVFTTPHSTEAMLFDGVDKRYRDTVMRSPAVLSVYRLKDIIEKVQKP